MTTPHHAHEMTDSALLGALGAALYGEHWKNPLANALGVSDRTLRRWLQTEAVPPGVWAEIAELAAEREAQLGPLAAAARARAGDGN